MVILIDNEFGYLVNKKRDGSWVDPIKSIRVLLVNWGKLKRSNVWLWAWLLEFVNVLD